MYRSPYSHLSWPAEKYRDYWDHLKMVGMDYNCGDPDFPRQVVRQRRREFIALREELFKVGHTFEGIGQWINANSRAIMLNPTIGPKGLRSRGFAFRFVTDPWPRWFDVVTYSAPREYGGVIHGEIMEGPGWKATGIIDVPSCTLWATDYMNALSALGLCVNHFSFDKSARSRRLEGRPENQDRHEIYANRYYVELVMFGMDFYSLAMLEKLHERAIDRGPEQPEED